MKKTKKFNYEYYKNAISPGEKNINQLGEKFVEAIKDLQKQYDEYLKKAKELAFSKGEIEFE